MATPERPLSPHLQIYRWQIQMVTSILHRATGVVLAIGALLIACGLLALAGGQESWNAYKALTGAWYGMVFMLGWTWCFAYHLINGIRHLLQDAGYGYGIPAFVRNGWISVIGSVLVTIAIWAWALQSGGLA